jgi:hypothetical protein
VRDTLSRLSISRRFVDSDKPTKKFAEQQRRSGSLFLERREKGEMSKGLTNSTTASAIGTIYSGAEWEAERSVPASRRGPKITS